MYERRLGSKFKKDIKRVQRRDFDMAKLKTVMTKITKGASLEKKYKDHPLIGQYKGYRDCHIEPDWVLIYRIADEIAYFYRTGTHSDVFK